MITCINQKLCIVEFRSPLHIGTVESDRILVHGATTRQYISYPDDGGDPVVKFVGERSLLKLNKIYHAFGQPFRVEILKKAAFRDSVVFAYTSTDEGILNNAWILSSFAVANYPACSDAVARSVLFSLRQLFFLLFMYHILLRRVQLYLSTASFLSISSADLVLYKAIDAHVS